MLKKFLTASLSLLTVLPTFISAAPVQAVTYSANLISNSSVETSVSNLPTDWSKNSWGQNSATFTYQNRGQSGNKSLYVRMNSYTSGDAKWYFTPVAATPNTNYLYSDYYKSSVATDLVVEIADNAGNLSYSYLATLAKSTIWKKASFTFTTSATATKLTIFHLINKVGTLQTDNFSLAYEIQPVTITDNVPNNSVEQVSPTDSTLPSAWIKSSWGTNSANFTYLNTGHSGTKSVKTDVSAYTSGDAKWSYPSQPVNPGTKLRFTDFYQSNIVSRVVVEITNTDQTKTYIDLKNAPVSANWAKYTDSFTTPATTVSLTVFHLISAVGSLTTDDYSLTTYSPEGFIRPLVTITFDDGFASEYTNGAALLSQYNFKGTFYVTTGFLNSNSYYMTNAMVSDLIAQGNQISDHTVTHPHLTTLSSAELDNELKNSQIYLQNNFGILANDFASPFGEVNTQVLSTAKTYFRSHRGVMDGFNSKDNFDIYNLKVQNVLQTTTPAQILAWIGEAAQTKTWLILVYHQIEVNTDLYAVSPSAFANHLGQISLSNIPVVTIDQALTEVLPQFP